MRLLLTLLAPLLATLSAPVLAEETAQRFVHSSPAPGEQAIASYGPFRVIDGQRVALVDVTSEHSPAQFAAMLRDFPALAVLELRECPGTQDDLANLRLGRMIRAARLETHVPDGGSVRSGGVELFLAGATRRIDYAAEFAVHAWADEAGLQATDYAASAPENRKYLAYYREMGMSPGLAAAFYAMINSVSFSQARWLTADDMRQWVEAATPASKPAAPVLAYLDLAPALN